MAKLLTGKEVVASMKKDLLARVSVLRAQGVVPKLAIVRVGARPDDLSYERTAIKRAESLGVEAQTISLDATVSQDVLMSVIKMVNADSEIHGCLLFRPLPKHIDEAAVCNALAPEKDIDGISRASLAALFTGAGEGFAPATAQACVEMLDCYNVPVEGKHVVVVGRSLVIGKPVSMMLLARNATVTMCHSRSENLTELTQAADIVVCATGRARGFGAQHFRKGQTVLDVGINFDEDGALCGDVDFEAVESVLGETGAITPVPGGLGSVTTSVTMAHVIKAAEVICSTSPIGTSEQAAAVALRST